MSESGKTDLRSPTNQGPVPGTVGISISLCSPGFLVTFCSQLAHHPPLPQCNSERALTMSSPNISFGNICLFGVCETPTPPQGWSRPDLTSERLYQYKEPIGYLQLRKRRTPRGSNRQANFPLREGGGAKVKHGWNGERRARQRNGESAGQPQT